jgi:hypothetical protein
VDVFLRNPVRTAGLIAIAINLAISFGLKLTGEQVSMLNAFVVAVLALLVPNYTTSTAAPRLDAGTTVEVITPGKEPNESVTL